MNENILAVSVINITKNNEINQHSKNDVYLLGIIKIVQNEISLSLFYFERKKYNLIQLYTYSVDCLEYIENIRRIPNKDENPQEIYLNKIFRPETNLNGISEPVKESFLNAIKSNVNTTEHIHL